MSRGRYSYLGRIALKKIGMPVGVHDALEALSAETHGRAVDYVEAIGVQGGAVTVRLRSGTSFSLSRHGALRLAARIIVLTDPGRDYIE